MSMPVSSMNPSTTPTAPPNEAEQAQRALVQQRREWLLVQQLLRDAEPPKNRMDAIQRSAFNPRSVTLDLISGVFITASFALAKTFFSWPRAWWQVAAIGLGILPASMALRGLAAAISGKAQGQEEAQRDLMKRGIIPSGTTSPITGQPIANQTISSTTTKPLQPPTQAGIATQPDGTASPTASTGTISNIPSASTPQQTFFPQSKPLLVLA